MNLLAHGESGHGWGLPIEPWEIHPALNHFPIAFLVGAVVLDLYAWWRGSLYLAQVASGLLITGFLSGVLTAIAGWLAFFTVPQHTAEAHRLMYWHIGIQATALVLFVWPTWTRWRNSSAPPPVASRCVVCLGALVLLVGSGIGGYIVFHGGAGVAPELLKTDLHGDHADGERHSPASHIP